MRPNGRWSCLAVRVVMTCVPLVAGGVTMAGCSGEAKVDPEFETGKSVESLTIPSGFVLDKCSTTTTCPGVAAGSCCWTGKSTSGATGTAVQIFRKPPPTGGQPDYVVVIDLRYASIKSLMGSTSGTCSRTGTKVLIGRKYLSSYWSDALSLGTGTRTPHAVLNGTFFSANDCGVVDSREIAFGLKSGSSIVTYGYGAGASPCVNKAEFPGQIKTFQWNASSASITPYSTSTFSSSAWPDVVGVLDATANKGTSPIPRTFVGIDDGDNETVIFYTSLMAKPSEAQSILASFGAKKNQAMLDGGGTSGLVVDGTAKVPNCRAMPHAFAIFSGQ